MPAKERAKAPAVTKLLVRELDPKNELASLLNIEAYLTRQQLVPMFATRPLHPCTACPHTCTDACCASGANKMTFCDEQKGTEGHHFTTPPDTPERRS